MSPLSEAHPWSKPGGRKQYRFFLPHPVTSLRLLQGPRWGRGASLSRMQSALAARGPRIILDYDMPGYEKPPAKTTRRIAELEKELEDSDGKITGVREEKAAKMSIEELSKMIVETEEEVAILDKKISIKNYFRSPRALTPIIGTALLLGGRSFGFGLRGRPHQPSPDDPLTNFCLATYGIPTLKQGKLVGMYAFLRAAGAKLYENGNIDFDAPFDPDSDSDSDSDDDNNNNNDIKGKGKGTDKGKSVAPPVENSCTSSNADDKFSSSESSTSSDDDGDCLATSPIVQNLVCDVLLGVAQLGTDGSKLTKRIAYGDEVLESPEYMYKPKGKERGIVAESYRVEGK